MTLCLLINKQSALILIRRYSSPILTDLYDLKNVSKQRNPEIARHTGNLDIQVL